MSESLTPEQKKRIQESRRLALQRRAEAELRLAAAQQGHSPKPLELPSRNIFPSTSASLGAKPKDKKPDWCVFTEQLTGTCCVIAPNKFILKIPYNDKVINIFIEADQKAWSFPLEQYQTLKDKLRPLAPNVIIGNIPNQVIKTLTSKSDGIKNYKDVDISKIESSLVESLFPFQKEGVQFGIAKNGRCLIADDMGLGKTLQAIAIADYYHDDWPLLIACPSTMKYQWQEEILKYLPTVPSYSIFVVNNGKDSDRLIEMKPQIVILSYELMAKLSEILIRMKFGMAIFDESHSLKNIKTKRTIAASKIVQHASRVLLLSGTPALSRPLELFSQIKLVQPRLFPDYVDYGLRYCDGMKDRFGWNFKGSSNLKELKVILEEKVMIRRLKSNVLHQLPAKLRQVFYLDPEYVDTKSKKLKKLEIRMNKEKEEKGIQERSTLISYYAETGAAKLKAIEKHIEELLEQNQKFLCFAHHKVVLDMVSKLLEDNQTHYIRIDGSVSAEERKDVCDLFQQNDLYRVAVLSVTAANTGITLTAASLIVFAELYWNPGVLLQAEDRAHRIGQVNCVNIQYLIARNTADDYIWPMVNEKLGVLKQAGLCDSQLTVEKEIDTAKASTSKQSSILEFFDDVWGDDVDNNELNSLMDKIDGVPEKKFKSC